MAARGARVTKRRISIMRETTLGTGDTGTIKHISAIQEEALAPLQETYDDQSQANDRNYQLPPWLGNKSNTLGFKVPYHKNLIVNLADVFESTFGTIRGSTNLTGVAYTTVSFTYSAGTPHDWVIFEDAGGRLIPRPVVRVIAGSPSTAHLGFALPTGYTPTSVKNPNQYGATTGKCLAENPNAAFLSLQSQIDRPGEPDVVNYVLKGMVPNLLRLQMQQGQRRMVEAGFMGTDWTQETGANLADAAKPVKQGASLRTECYILSDFASLGADPVATPIISYNINVAPEWLKLDSSVGRAGSDEDVIPASSVIEWRKGRSLVEGTMEIVTRFSSTDWEAARAAETDLDIAIIDYIGNPAGAFSGDMVCHFYPKARIKEITTPGNNGVDGNRLLLHLRDERDVGTSAGNMSSGLIRKHDFAQFIS